MTDLSVPKVEVDAELLHDDGRRVRGHIFLPPGTPLHAGTALPKEWADEPAPFFPFRPDGSSDVVLLNKHRLLSVTVPAALDVEDTDEAAPLRAVVLTVGGREIRGQVRMEVRPGWRLLELLNNSSAFLTLTDGDRHHIVRKAAIEAVADAG